MVSVLDTTLQFRTYLGIEGERLSFYVDLPLLCDVPVSNSVSKIKWKGNWEGLSYPLSEFKEIVLGNPIERFSVKGPELYFTPRHNELLQKTPKRFAMRLERQFSCPEGVYMIQSRSNDGVRIRIDGFEIYSNWLGHAELFESAAVELGTGSHSIAIDYGSLNDNWGTLHCDLRRIE